MPFWDAAADLLARLFKGRGHGVGELARRLGAAEAELRAVRPTYHAFRIPKRAGGSRLILAPDAGLKALQRRILRRLLRRLRCHPAATAFERGRSIVANARPHAGKVVVARAAVRC